MSENRLPALIDHLHGALSAQRSHINALSRHIAKTRHHGRYPSRIVTLLQDIHSTTLILADGFKVVVRDLDARSENATPEPPDSNCTCP